MKWRCYTHLSLNGNLNQLYHLEDEHGQLVANEHGLYSGIASYLDGRHTRFIGSINERIDPETFARYLRSADDFHMEELL